MDSKTFSQEECSQQQSHHFAELESQLMPEAIQQTIQVKDHPSESEEPATISRTNTIYPTKTLRNTSERSGIQNSFGAPLSGKMDMAMDPTLHTNTPTAHSYSRKRSIYEDPVETPWIFNTKANGSTETTNHGDRTQKHTKFRFGGTIMRKTQFIARSLAKVQEIVNEIGTISQSLENLPPPLKRAGRSALEYRT